MRFIQINISEEADFFLKLFGIICGVFHLIFAVMFTYRIFGPKDYWI